MPAVEPDALVNISEVNDRLWLALARIAPFGAENRQPLFAARGVELAGPPQAWQARGESANAARHLRVALRQSGGVLMMKGWGMGALAEELHGVAVVDVAFTVERDLYGGWGATVARFAWSERDGLPSGARGAKMRAWAEVFSQYWPVALFSCCPPWRSFS